MERLRGLEGCEREKSCVGKLYVDGQGLEDLAVVSW